MCIVTIELDNETVLAIQGSFEAADADALHELLPRMERDRAVTIDFRGVRCIQDFLIARLAQDFARTSICILGLSEHHRRILRFFARGSALTRAGGSLHEPVKRGELAATSKRVCATALDDATLGPGAKE